MITLDYLAITTAVRNLYLIGFIYFWAIITVHFVVIRVATVSTATARCLLATGIVGRTYTGRRSIGRTRAGTSSAALATKLSAEATTSAARALSVTVTDVATGRTIVEVVCPRARRRIGPWTGRTATGPGTAVRCGRTGSSATVDAWPGSTGSSTAGWRSCGRRLRTRWVVRTLCLSSRRKQGHKKNDDGGK